MLIVCPVVRLYTVIFEVLQSSCSKLRTLSDNLSTRIVFHTLRNLALSQCEQLIYEDILQVLTLCLIFLVDFSENNLILLLRFASLDSTREHLLVDDDTAQRRVSLQ